MKKVFLLITLLFTGFCISAQDRQSVWVDSVLKTMSVPEKIGQLFMLTTSSNPNPHDAEDLTDLIKDWHPGSILITGGGPKSTATFSARFNRSAKIPMLLGINAASGLGDHLDSAERYFTPMALGAVANDTTVYNVGATIGQQMKMVGLHLNLAPNVSVCAEWRSYGNYFSDDLIRAEKRSRRFLEGLQSQGILACIIQQSKQRGLTPDGKDSVVYYESVKVDTAWLHSFKRVAASGIDGVVTSQFRFSIQENKKPTAAAISSAFTNEILKQDLGFHGLAFCEIPDLVKTSGKRKKGEVELLALMAGNDVLIAPDNISAAVKLIQKTLKKNNSLQSRIDESVRKILMAKYKAGLSRPSKIDLDNLWLRMHSPEDKLFKQETAEKIVTLVRNTGSIVPIMNLQDRKFSFVSIGAPSENEFQRYLKKYTAIESIAVKTIEDSVGLEAKLKGSDVIIVGIYSGGESFQGYLLPAFQHLARSKQVVLCFFGNPLGVRNFAGFPVLLNGYSDDPLIQKVMAEVIFGGLEAKGELPVTINKSLIAGFHVSNSPLTAADRRLSYSIPEAVGMDSKTLEQIKSIAMEAIDMKATPGLDVLVAKNGQVIYEQSFGYLTYDKKSPVTDETIYDLASVTKVSATLQTVMFMYEKGLIDVNKKVSYYLPELRKSNKKDFTIKDILTHQAGLWPFLPFWAQTVKDTVQLPEYYSKVGSPDYPYPVAANLYASRSMKDSLWHWIINSKIQEKVNHTPYDYKYSDMGFYIMMHLAEKLLNQPMNEFLDQNFYEVLGATTTGYLPLLRFPASRIAPTEDDKVFRRSLLVGYVHDQGAAMHGGIAGHAGLFSTPNDLAKLAQMWLQKGTYGGHRFFKPETIDFFTMKQFEHSRRGLGWDKPVVSDPNGPTSAFASPKTFGHTGFTGISIWVDPEFDLVFIFFSNRVYPEMTNNKILNANIRPRVQDVVYRSIFKYCENHK